jgi:hypothetical protein
MPLAAHRLDDQVAVLDNHHRRILSAKYPRAKVLRICSTEVVDLGADSIDLIGRDPSAFGLHTPTSNRKFADAA